jgi:fibronectin-binding autotransporter adhesin
VGNSRTEVLTASGGVTGTFDEWIKHNDAAWFSFTDTTLHYDAGSVWLDTSTFDVTTVAAGNGVSYTPLSMASAQRVQGAFEQLDRGLASGGIAGVSSDFLRSAGRFQQAPTRLAAQASLRSLSGQLHADSAALTLKAIDASTRAVASRFDALLGNAAPGMWTQDLSAGGSMVRGGFDDIGYRVDGWLVGSDRKFGNDAVAGFAFGRGLGQQWLRNGMARNASRSTEGMFYAGWLRGDWYAQGRLGFGHFERDVDRRLLLGTYIDGVQTRYGGDYSLAYGESGHQSEFGGGHLTAFASLEYARIGRDGFVEQGAGGFGLRSEARALARLQAGLGMRAARRWEFGAGRFIDASARAQWQRGLSDRGEAFDASFVGLEQWGQMVGVGFSRDHGTVGFALDAGLSRSTSLKFGYDLDLGGRGTAQTLSAWIRKRF